MATNFISCSVEGCNGNANGIAGGCRGFCGAHYARLKRYGDPLAGRPPKNSVLKFVLEVVMSHQGDECLLWPHAKRSDYGQLNVNGKRVYAHRHICELVHGEPPSQDLDAAHSCGNTQCVNPNHLGWKTRSENEADKLIHGTHNRGERQGIAKLTEHQAREILRLKGTMSQYKIAAVYGVSRSTIVSIYRRQSWSWLQSDAP